MLRIITCILLTLSWSAWRSTQQPSQSEGATPAPPDPSAAPEIRAIPIAFTVSGGGAQGAYMSGQLFYFEQLIKASRATSAPLRPVIFSGTSSGSTISLLAALNSCQDHSDASRDSPHDSLYWESFIPVGLRALISNQGSSALHALSRRPFLDNFEKIKPLLKRGFSKDCSFIYSAAIHRVNPRQRKLHSQSHLKLAVSSELVSVKVTGQGSNRYPKIANFVDPELRKGQLLLPLDGLEGPDADEQRLDLLRRVVFASMALPGLLEPQEIRHCIYDHATTRCTDEMAQAATFVDGGIFNNRPLGLAIRAAQVGLRPLDANQVTPTSAQMLRREPHAQGELSRQVRFLLIDPSIDAYPGVSLQRRAVSYLDKSVMTLIGDTLKSFLSVARSAELLGVFERHPQLERQLITSLSYYPMFSDLLSGFFDQEFREFDFYLGMYDSARAFAERAWDRSIPSLKSLTAPERTFTRDDAAPELKAAWTPMLCIRAYLETQLKAQPRQPQAQPHQPQAQPNDTSNALSESCLNPNAKMRNFKILSQVSLDRLYHHCSVVREGLAPDPHPNPTSDPTSARAQGRGARLELISHPYCDEVLNGGAPRTIRGLPSLKPHERRPLPHEPELRYVFRLLARYGYEFRELKLSPEQGDQALALMVAELHKLVALFAGRQDAVTSSVMQTMSQTALNRLAYVAPRDQLHLNVGYQLEGGWSRRLMPSGLLRGGAVLELEGVTSPLNPTPNFLAVIPQLALLSDFSLTSSDIARGQLGIRAGYQLSTADRFSSQRCDVTPELSLMCSRVQVQGVAALRVANRLRLQLSVVWGPRFNGMRSFVQLSPSVGLEWNSF